MDFLVVLESRLAVLCQDPLGRPVRRRGQPGIDIHTLQRVSAFTAGTMLFLELSYMYMST